MHLHRLSVIYGVALRPMSQLLVGVSAESSFAKLAASVGLWHRKMPSTHQSGQLVQPTGKRLNPDAMLQLANQVLLQAVISRAVLHSPLEGELSVYCRNEPEYSSSGTALAAQGRSGTNTPHAYRGCKMKCEGALRYHSARVESSVLTVRLLVEGLVFAWSEVFRVGAR